MQDTRCGYTAGAARGRAPGCDQDPPGPKIVGPVFHVGVGMEALLGRRCGSFPPGPQHSGRMPGSRGARSCLTVSTLDGGF